ncbi:MAG: hypothetical protein Q8Q14_12030 [Gemmatimonadales bacterium]|nr:hypothetical protein [Gemmatimonadales bacterium]
MSDPRESPSGECCDHERVWHIRLDAGGVDDGLSRCLLCKNEGAGGAMDHVWRELRLFDDLRRLR